jgi:hypothetical protein
MEKVIRKIVIYAMTSLFLIFCGCAAATIIYLTVMVFRG